MKVLLEKQIPDYSVRGGMISMDTTTPGIDKACEIRRFRDLLSIAGDTMIFAGGPFSPGGNECPVEGAAERLTEVGDSNKNMRVAGTINACPGGATNTAVDEEQRR